MEVKHDPRNNTKFHEEDSRVEVFLKLEDQPIVNNLFIE
jgi:hypothetical protein